VLRADEGGVVTLTLNRGERFNPLSREMIAALQAELDAVAGDPDARVVVLAAEGRGFSAGHDLKEMRAHVGDDAWQRGLFDACNRMMVSLTQLPQPVIARVHGIATAAGCQLVAACDLAVASEEARFATPGVKIGLFCSTPMVPVSRAVGRKRALELLLTGEPIDARTALEWGLVNRVVPAADLDAAVAELVDRVAASSPFVVALGKEAFYAQVDLDEHRAYDLTKAVMAMNATAADAQEGFCAFLEKRSPTWTGR
jgi:enoyl-CoA hydratase/carnithine racemase